MKYNMATPINLREARVSEITQMHKIRTAFTENALSRPDSVTPDLYEDMITTPGKGWVWELDDELAEFAVVDLKKNNVWGLFADPESENRGIGKTLQDHMPNW